MSIPQDPVAGEPFGEGVGPDSEIAWATLAALVDCLFPPIEETPGATALGVVDFIRGQLAGPRGRGEHRYNQEPFLEPSDSGHGPQSQTTPIELYAAGLRALDDDARQQGATGFSALESALQSDAVGRLEAGRLEAIEPAAGRAFFAQVREHVLEGLFTDPRHGGNRDRAGWRWLGYPGPPALADDLAQVVLPPVILTPSPGAEAAEAVEAVEAGPR